MMQKLNTSKIIGIVGLGLIGGSLGLALQKLGHKVYGITHRSITAKRAEERGLANLVSTNPKILKKCSIIIIALPLQNLLNPDPQLINSLPKDAVITDVGSVKAPILKLWRNLHPLFIASHPMAGTNHSGVEAGIENLFINKPWVSTPEQKTNHEALQVIHELAISLGCNWITTEASLHDKAVALISHLPVLISAALLKTAANEKNKEILNLSKHLASSGFADTTRIGGGNAELGLAMVQNNTSAIISALNSYKDSLRIFEESIITNQWDTLRKELEKTKNNRSDFFQSP